MNTTKKIAKAMQDVSKAKTSAYDTTAVVQRIEGNTAWVHIPGGVDETPVKMTINAKQGDSVQVRVSDGSAWLVGNSSAPPTDDARANTAYIVATDANDLAESASKAATEAWGFAETARSAAVTAETHANEAKASAQNASEYAARALGNLSTVQSVTETLTWITQHGTMALTTDVALDPTHVYFVVDAGGDYTVGGVTYAIVTEPDVADIGTYYELTIDESLNNYVGTHLALTSEGLWLLPASSGTNKVLIATGAGSVYTTAGTYIIDSDGTTVLASFLASGAQIGQDNNNQIKIDTDAIRLRDEYNDDVFIIGFVDNIPSQLNETITDNDVPQVVGGSKTIQLRSAVNYSDTATASIKFTYPGSLTKSVSFTADGTKSITNIGTWSIAVNGDTVTLTCTTAPTGWSSQYSHIAFSFAYYGTSKQPTLDFGHNNETSQLSSSFGEENTVSAPDSMAVGILNTVSGNEPVGIAFGRENTVTGRYSMAQGYKCEASGQYGSFAHGELAKALASHSHAEGYSTQATGSYGSHAEGSGSIAAGNYSHAQNRGTKASSNAQTALGKYNIEDSADTYAVIIGNGTADNARSDALEVDWTGDVFLALDTTAASGTDHDLYAAITALSWQSNVIV